MPVTCAVARIVREVATVLLLLPADLR